MRGGDPLDPFCDSRLQARQAFFAAATGTPVSEARAAVPMGRQLPTEDDERALEFLHDCSYDVDKASLLLASIAGGGQEVSALRHIEAARSHVLGGKVSEGPRRRPRLRPFPPASEASATTYRASLGPTPLLPREVSHCPPTRGAHPVAPSAALIHPAPRLLPPP